MDGTVARLPSIFSPSFVLKRALPYEYGLNDLHVLFLYSRLMNRRVAARFACPHGPLKQERERERLSAASCFLTEKVVSSKKGKATFISSDSDKGPEAL